VSEFNEEDKGSVNIEVLEGIFNSEVFEVDDISIVKGMDINGNIYFDDSLFLKVSDLITIQIPISKVEKLLEKVRLVLAFTES
jgi:hypothetical protein